MDSKDELLPEEDQITPKIEPIDTDFIKEEEFLEEEFSVDPGVTVSFKVNKVSLKEEICDKEEIEDCLLSNVWNTVLFNDTIISEILYSIIWSQNFLTWNFETLAIFYDLYINLKLLKNL